MSDSATNNAYAKTLNLPQTTFGLRANAQTKEPELLARWQQEDLYRKATDLHKGGKQFVLHSGPPYANGHLHIGHALTYILKDMVSKTKRMEGYHAPLLPGWDCHGLPIELKVSAELAQEGGTKLDRVAFKQRCRDYANKWIAVQRDELKGLGEIADYDNAYITMSYDYEASILEALSDFVKGGYIERKNKTVPWCPSCQTVLAAAEIEYEDRKDPSVTVLFGIPDDQARLMFPFLYEKVSDLHISLAVWTTTPWTLPLNRAVALNPKTVYVVVQGKTPRQAFVVAKERVDAVCSQLGITPFIYAEADAIVFENAHVQNPCVPGQMSPVILDEHVQTGDGTAVLHVAPGCGPDDYALGLKHNLEIFSPMGADGRYTKGIAPADLEGKTVQEGQGWAIKTMEESGTLLHKTSLMHSYPHCWRCHGGLIFRATKQWFCNLQQHSLVPRTLEQIEQINFVPEWGKNRLHAFVGNRSEWCISRQRQWGVPIPALLCNACDQATFSHELISKVAKSVAQEGIEYWDKASVASLKQDGVLPTDFACAHCGEQENLRKEQDILDVWFDSGASSFAVLHKNHAQLGLKVPADMYFEGSDQHRGWFQSSLLCGMVLFGHSPMRTIVTHGFIVDENKHKMSKSKGNVIAPQDIVTKYSRDVLRLWVATVDFEGDVVISHKLLENVADMYRKLRNTMRFLISNLYDFNHQQDALSLDDLEPLDHYVLAQLHEVSQATRAAYSQYRFAHACALLNAFCTTTLSAVYFDIVKDRLYTEAPAGKRRRAAQTTLYHLLDTLCRLLAPVLSFTTEEIADHYQAGKEQSIHMQPFVQTIDVWEQMAQKLFGNSAEPVAITGQVGQDSALGAVKLKALWNLLEELRAAVTKAIEPLREQGVIKHSLEAYITLAFDKNKSEYELLRYMEIMAQKSNLSLEQFIAEWCIVSQVSIADSEQELSLSVLPCVHLKVERAAGSKCPRCWRYSTSQQPEGLCSRCHGVLQQK